MSRPDLSVIIVSWNTCDLLRDCLRSLSAKSVELETIVVDNGSTDGTLAMLRAEFPQVRVIANAENRGFASANNQGLETAQGRYCILLNSDTLVQANTLDTLVAFMDSHADAGACGPQLRNADGTLQPSGRAFPTLRDAVVALLPMPRALRRALANPIERRDYTRIAAVDEVSGAALVLRRAGLEQVGNLDERFFFLGEDVDICWRMKEAGWKVYYAPAARVTHFGGASRSRQSERTSLLSQRALVLLFQKHRSRFDAKVVVALSMLTTLLKALRRVGAAMMRGDRAAASASWLLHRDEWEWLRSQ